MLEAEKEIKIKQKKCSNSPIHLLKNKIDNIGQLDKPHTLKKIPREIDSSTLKEDYMNVLPELTTNQSLTELLAPYNVIIKTDPSRF